MIMFGLLLSMVGSDIETGQSRMAFDIPELADGIGFVVVAMGVFGFAEIMRNLEQTESRDIVQAKITGLMPTLDGSQGTRAGAIARGTVLGSILGILPGGGAVIAAFAAYTFEKKMSKDPGALRPAARSRAWRRRKAPTTRRRRPRSSRCSRSAFRPTP